MQQKIFVVLCIFCLSLKAFPSPNPQEPTYSIIESSNCNAFGEPQSVNEDTSGRNCIEFASDGFRCVPFYACNGGEIITNGDGIVDIRGANLAPLDSKCSGEIEVCCRHPDWKDVPLTTFVEVLKPAADCNENNDDYNYYPDYYDEEISTCSKDGVTYQDLEEIPSGDSCNDCSCDFGQIICTEEICPETISADSTTTTATTTKSTTPPTNTTITTATTKTTTTSPTTTTKTTTPATTTTKTTTRVTTTTTAYTTITTATTKTTTISTTTTTRTTTPSSSTTTKTTITTNRTTAPTTPTLITTMTMTTNNTVITTYANFANERLYVGQIAQYSHGVSGTIFYFKDDNQLVIENFKYDGLAPDTFFWVGTQGAKPSSNGIILPYPFQGQFFDSEDTNVPILDKAYDGSQQAIELTLPNDLKVSDLKWISVWCREYEENFGDFIFENPEPIKKINPDTGTIQEPNYTIIDVSTCESYGAPQNAIEYEKTIKCSAFTENGFRCVPFYACKGGSVITDRGSGILKTGKTGLIHLVPNSKCTTDQNEICCQHSDWKDVPIRTSVQIKRPPQKCFVSDLPKEDAPNIQIGDYIYEYDYGNEDYNLEKPKTQFVELLELFRVDSYIRPYNLGPIYGK